jgi:hypothetical protein
MQDERTIFASTLLCFYSRECMVFCSVMAAANILYEIELISERKLKRGSYYDSIHVAYISPILHGTFAVLHTNLHVTEHDMGEIRCVNSRSWIMDISFIELCRYSEHEHSTWSLLRTTCWTLIHFSERCRRADIQKGVLVWPNPQTLYCDAYDHC